MKLLYLILLFSLSCTDSKQNKSQEINTQNITSDNTEKSQSNITNSEINTYDNQEIEQENLNFTFQVLGTIPHDTKAYTQGFVFYNGYLYESTGQYGRSSLRKISPLSGEILKKESVNMRYFAEGIEVYDNKLYMLTWQNSLCKVYDIETFNEVKEFRYVGEGWGLCFIKNYFYMSNGSNVIQVIEPNEFKVVDSFEVFDFDGFPVMDINELEFAKGYIFANLWLRDKIAIIDPIKRKLVNIIDFSELRKQLRNQRIAETMNGIAYDKENDVFYLTGKNWDTTFIVKIK
jgi:glutamine cyclotransferase